MSTQHIATAAVVKVSVGDPGGNTLARLVYRGGVVPDGVSEKDIARLVERGLIAEVEIEDSDQVEDEAYEGVGVKDLKAAIAERNKDREDGKKIVPAEPGNRPELVAALVADDAANA